MIEMTDQSEQIVDELLVMECQDGSVQALDRLVRRWQKRLWHYACRLTGDPEAAWEVMQESWLSVLRGLRRLDDPARFRPWVYRIVTRRADDWIAGRAKARCRRAEMSQTERTYEHRQDPEEADELRRLLSGLPEQSRTALTLHYLEDLPVAEIASVLGIPEGTVKSRLHTARAELKARWRHIQQQGD